MSAAPHSASPPSALEARVDAVGGTGDAPAVRLGCPVWTPVGLAAGSSGAPMLTLGRMHSLTLAMLVAVVMAATYGIVRIERGDRWDHQLVVWSTCGMLVCLAIFMLLMGRYLLQRSLRHVEDQLRTLTREDRLDPLESPVPEELQATLTALEEYVERVRTRMDRLRVQKKELDLHMRAAQAERRHTAAIIHSISDAVMVIDPFGELVLANPAAERLFAFELSEARHRPIERIIQDPSVIRLIKEARAASDTSPRREVEYSQLRDGKLQTFMITLSRVVDEDGESRGIVAILHDVTRERELARIKTDFVSAVSHELRTPLSSIRAYIEMLVDGEAGDEQTRLDFYKIVESETDRLQRLISNVLDISRIESGVMDIRRVQIRPQEVIGQVLDLMAPQAREKDITVEAEYGEALPTIEADRDLLYQAVQNVVSNAIKYTPPGGKVCVRADTDQGQGHFTIAVSDTGMGIAQEELPRVFDKFFRSREGIAVAKGTGLGLNLVKEIVETVHGGAIDVSSERGVGTTFVLRFPLSRAGLREAGEPGGGAVNHGHAARSPLRRDTAGGGSGRI